MGAAYRWEADGSGRLFLMRGVFGMAELLEWPDGWHVRGYGFGVRIGPFSLEDAKAFAISDANRVFKEAGLTDVR